MDIKIRYVRPDAKIIYTPTYQEYLVYILHGAFDTWLQILPRINKCWSIFISGWLGLFHLWGQVTVFWRDDCLKLLDGRHMITCKSFAVSVLTFGFLFSRAAQKSSDESETVREYLWMFDKHSVTAVPTLVFGSLYFSRMTETNCLAALCSKMPTSSLNTRLTLGVHYNGSTMSNWRFSITSLVTS